ncbi:MAG: energy transducer TonB, partial [Anaerolineales bacterium]
TSSFPDYSRCSDPGEWATSPKLRFPPSYNQRAIEGWAVLSFDVSVDGSIGNIEVLAAQPTEEFGEAAEAVFQTGRLKEGDVTRSRCIERITFKMNKASP